MGTLISSLKVEKNDLLMFEELFYLLYQHIGVNIF